jgi:hypothetical protein
MTEAEWLAAKHPGPMLEWIEGKTTERKRMLISVACCRRLGRLVTSDRRIQVVIVSAEESADGTVNEAKLLTARMGVSELFYEHDREADELDRLGADSLAASSRAFACASRAAEKVLGSNRSVEVAACAAHAANWSAWPSSDARANEEERQGCLVRDVVGNPFRPVRVNPSWLTADIVHLAHAAYEERILPSGDLDPHRLAVLADALEEAGADALVAHLRLPGPHVRGCWAIDLLSSRE